MSVLPQIMPVVRTHAKYLIPVICRLSLLNIIHPVSCSERYVDIILKMEEMLKTWFPNVKPSHQTTAVELTHETALLKKPKVTRFAIVVLTHTICFETEVLAEHAYGD